MTQEIAMDLGTANTVIFQNDQIVLDEPSIVAIDNNTGKAIALGQKAKLMQERENPGIKTVHKPFALICTEKLHRYATLRTPMIWKTS